MRAYSSSELAEIVKQLQAKHHEGDYWDFKQEWWEPKDSEMIKDILCFANTVHSRDCFIILGIENNNYTVVPFQKPRKKQADVLDTLSKVKFAGENIPDVSVYSDIPLDGGIVDVMVIHDSDRTPFYLSEDKQSLKQGRIYTRTGDRNTASDSNATALEIEQLWKKRFHLSQPVLEQFMKELGNHPNWQYTENDTYYNVYRPEFTLVPNWDSRDHSFREFYTELFPDQNSSSLPYECKYYGTYLKCLYIASLDGGRYHIPYPDVSNVKDIDNMRFFYMMEDSDKMKVLKFLTHFSLFDWSSYSGIFFSYIPLFKNWKERDAFKQWLEENYSLFVQRFDKVKKSKLRSFSCDLFQRDAIAGKVIIQLLGKFRGERL